MVASILYSFSRRNAVQRAEAKYPQVVAGPFTPARPDVTLYTADAIAFRVSGEPSTSQSAHVIT